MLPKNLLLSISSLFTYNQATRAQQTVLEAATPRLTFQLRHIHALLPDSSRSLFHDVHSSPSPVPDSVQRIHTNSLLVHKPHFVDSIDRTLTLPNENLWDLQPVLAPNVSDRSTLFELAKMCNNAYFEPVDERWYDLGGKWDNFPFGWEPSSSGFRGHVFVSLDNSTVILTIKGTSLIVGPGTGGPTGKQDKLNDNLLFSCCCAKGSWGWKPACDCYRGRKQCKSSCLEDSLEKKSLFHNIGVNLYNNVTAMYPNSNIWIIGHSLGGSISSLLGAKFGAPVVTFEAPGEALAAQRLRLSTPPSMHHITHFMHNADPIAMGTCNGPFSPCGIVGYSLETRCHLGQIILLDTVNELHWAVDFRTHPIRVIVERLLGENSDWFEKGEEGVGVAERIWCWWSKLWWGKCEDKKKKERRGLPKPVPEEEDCLETECYAWEFI